MARKGTATIKTATKGDRNTRLSSPGEDTKSASTASEQSNTRKDSLVNRSLLAREPDKIGAAASSESPNPSNKSPKPDPEPRQASATVDQSKTLAESLFPSNVHQDTSSVIQGRTPSAPSAPSLHAAPQRHSQRRIADPLPPINQQPSRQRTEGIHTMALPGGAAIPPNQQRNMRACMVCSIVRTQQQFMTSGCPNCEDILELAGNSEQINDCTSQVFDGLISVADTKRSWVARYQRLEGYVPGVYATQVEGILPEDVIVAVENAGINYVPRDGSEQEMLPKD